MKKLNRFISFFLALIMAVELLPISYARAATESEIPVADYVSETVEESEIIEEIETLREEDAKYFLTDKGTTIMAQYGVPVHFEEDGKWEEIDNSLSDSEDGADLENKKSKLKIKLSKKSNGSKLVSLKEGNYGISWNFKNANKVDAEIVKAESEETDDKTAVKNAMSSAIYKGIFKNTDIEYIISGNSVKENIILNSADAPTEYVYEFKANGLIAEKTEEGNIRFYSEDGEFEYTFAVPVIYDASFKALENFTITLSGNKNKYEVTLKIDEEFLKAEDRAFPIIIDPIVSTGCTEKGHLETYTYEYGEFSNANHYYSYEHTNAGIDMTGARMRALFKLNSHPTLKSSDKIVRAYLQLHTIAEMNYANWSTHTDFGEDLKIGVYQMTKPWDNSVTWNSMWGTDSTNGFNPEAMDYQTITADGRYQFDITRAAKNWYDDNFNNDYGVMFKLVNEEIRLVDGNPQNNQVYFYSSDYRYDTEIIYPWSMIEYRNTNGLEDYYTYETASNAAGTAYVNHYTGAVSFTHGDLSYSDNFGTVELSHTYNSSLDVNNNVAGSGWSINLFSKIQVFSNNRDYKCIYTDGDGTDHYFCEENDEGWIDEDGLGMTFIEAERKISFNDGSYMLFGEDNDKKESYLSEIVDAAGHKISINETRTTVTLDGLIVATISYSGGKISAITDKYGRTTTYSYTSDNLTKITYPDGTYSDFTYDTSGNLIGVYAPGDSGYRQKIEICYERAEGASRATSLYSTAEGTEERHGISNINYLYKQTTLTYTDGSWMVCQFDEYGRTVCAYDSFGNASSGTYESQHSAAKNNLASQTGYFSPSFNYVKNGAFIDNEDIEFSTCWTKSSYSIAISSEESSVYGNSVEITSSGGDEFVKTEISAPAGKIYTASAYIKTENVEGSGGAGIKIITSSGRTIYSDFLKGTTISLSDEGYRRVTLTTELNSDESITSVSVGLFSASGTAYVSGVTLCKGEYATTITQNSNGSFELGDAGWSLNGAAISTAEKLSGDSALKIIGSPKGVYNAFSEIGIAGVKGDTYTFGGMAKASSVPNLSENNNRSFCLELQFKNASGEYETGGTTEFNRVVREWQYSSETVTAPSDYSNVRIVVRYENNCNTAYFDDIFLIRGTKSTYTYDEEGNLVSSSDSSGAETDYVYGDKGNPTVISTPDGNNSYYDYDANGNLIFASSNVSQKTDVDYDENDNPILSTLYTVERANGAVEYGKEYNFGLGSDDKLLTASDNALTIANPAGGDKQKFVVEYVSEGRQKIKSVSTGKYLNFEANGDGLTLDDTGGLFHVCKVGEEAYQIRVVGSGVAYGCVAIEEDEVKILSLGDSWDGEEAFSKYHWVLESEKAGDKIITSSGYSEDGRHQTSVTDERGNTVTTEYDSYDRVSSTISAKGNKTTYTYSDANDRLLSLSSGESKIDYTYNADGSLETVQSPTSRYTFGKDLIGRDIFTKVGSRILASNSYDSLGRLSAITYGNGDIESYTFGSKNEIASVLWNGVEKYRYIYDENGNILSVSGAHSDYRYSYDLLGRLTSFFGKGNHSGAVSYDDQDREKAVISLVDGNGFITEYTYNDKGLLTAVMSSSATESGKTENGIVFSKTNSYDDLGRLAKSIFNTATPLEVTYSYTAGATEGTTTNLVASVDIGGKKLSYTYDEDGNITEIWENGTLKESYEYDSLNQMVRENNLDNNKTILYTYDKSGNIREKQIYPYAVGAVSGTPETITYSYDDEDWGDLLTAYNGEVITYDEIGNPLNYRDGMTFGWDGGRKLTSFSTPNAVGSYVYNSDGIRVYKEVNGNTTEYYLNGTQIETEITNFGGVTRRVDYIYDENGSIYGFVVDNTNKYYYTKNLQGDVIGILDASGTTIVEYSYDAWGKATVSYPNADSLTKAQKQANYFLGSNNPFRYRGYYFDNETGFYYLNSRYYDPEVGRFINADSQLNLDQSVLGANLFTYCLNTPVKQRDPFGYKAIDITWRLTKTMYANAMYLYSLARLYRWGGLAGTLMLLYKFYTLVRNGGKWDLKRQKSWQLKNGDYYTFMGVKIQLQDIGNIHFGFVGSVIFSWRTLCSGAGLYQIYSGTSSWRYWYSFFDDPRDTFCISLGRSMWGIAFRRYVFQM